ncbi:MAG: hypothetical protein RLZZ453_920 [Chlamydiota bacterium]|jgi:phosphoribosyl 1,2-cyclic phosphate phosphodiesterase
MKGKLLFLGTGGSAGVPMIGCCCEVCQSSFLHNQRWRSSALLKVDNKQILIDAGPDFRAQALKFGISHLDAVLLTHAHADHIGGMDDLRSFYFVTRKKLPCFLSEDTLREVRLRFHYFFKEIQPQKSVAAQVDFFPFPADAGECSVEGIPIHYFSYFQTGMRVTGFRIGSFAYVSDIREYGASVIHALEGVKVLVLSALRHTASPLHFNVEEAIAFARRVGAGKTYLTHISHELDHEATNSLLPNDIRMGYDGLEIEW